MIGIRLERGIAPCLVERTGLHLASAAELRQPLVGDAMCGQGFGQRIAGEIRIAARSGKAAHVGDRLDPVLGQQAEDHLQRAGRVADRPDCLRVGGSVRGRHRSVDLVQRRALVHRDVIGLVALDLVLRIGFAATVRVALVVGIARVHLDDRSAHVTGFGIPANVIADFERMAHGDSAMADPEAIEAGRLSS